VSENWYLHECNQLVHEREDRIAVLESENAALWTYYRASEAWSEDESDDTFEAVLAAQEAVRRHEAQP
jgi:hypothetical protein